MGTVIPQARWSPDNATDYRNHVIEAVLQMPIFVMQKKKDILGLSLADAINGRFQTLRDARMLAQLGGRTTMHICIAVRDRWPRVFVLNQL